MPAHAYKPGGYNSLSAYLIVADAQAALDFIAKVFGAEPLFIHRRDDGAISHVEVRIDDTMLMLGQSDSGGSTHLHVYVPDVDASYRQALDAGGASVQPPMEKGDGDRRGGVSDPQGTTWWFSTQIVAR